MTVMSSSLSYDRQTLSRMREAICYRVRWLMFSLWWRITTGSQGPSSPKRGPCIPKRWQDRFPPERLDLDLRRAKLSRAMAERKLREARQLAEGAATVSANLVPDEDFAAQMLRAMKRKE
jgi:hypothetical protein